MCCATVAGVVESQQHQLQAAAAAQQQLLHLLAQQSAPTPLTALPGNQEPTSLQSQAAVSESGTWPVSAAGSSSYLASTCSKVSTCSTQLDSTTGSCSSETAGRVSTCAGSTAGEWAVTVQPPGSLGTHLHVTISRSRLHPVGWWGGGVVSSSSSAGSTSTAGCLQSPYGCQPVTQQQDQQATPEAVLSVAPGLPKVFGHNSSFRRGMQCNKTPVRPLSEG